MSPSSPSKSVPSVVAEVWQLIVAYFKQEAIDPLKQLGRFLAIGMAGALLLTLGVVMLTMAGLRALQTETDTTFTGNWSWAPYLITLVGCGLVAALAARAITAKSRKARA
jgi:hypothetical protein